MKKGKKGVSVWYESKLQFRKEMTRLVSSNAEDAIIKTKRLINDTFIETYDESVKDSTENRLDHMYYWRDKLETTMRPGWFDTGV